MTVTNYKSIDRGAVVASFDLELDSGMVVYGMKLMNGKNGRWVGFPERPYQQNGETKYAKIIGIPNRERSDKFRDLVLSVLDGQDDS